MAVTLDAYVSLPEFRNALLREQLPSDADDELIRWLNVGKTEIDHWCRRVFVPVTSTVTLDAAATPDLRVPDILSITSVMAYGDLLSAGTDYRAATDDPADPYRLRPWAPHYTRLERLASGRPVRWQADVTEATGQIVIVFSEGYAATVPDAIVIANTRIAARGWLGRIGAYGDNSATDGQPAQTTETGWIAGDPELVRLLTPYRRLA